MRWILVVLTALSIQACTTAYEKSVGGDTDKSYTRVFFTDATTTWAAVIDSLKSAPLDVADREAGFIRTKWIDNTDDRNLRDPLGQSRSELRSRYRFLLSISAGSFEKEVNGKKELRPAVKVNVKKEQAAQMDALEAWRIIPADGIDENTLLYRIGRLIFMKTKIAEMEQDRIEKEFKNTDFN